MPHVSFWYVSRHRFAALSLLIILSLFVICSEVLPSPVEVAHAATCGNVTSPVNNQTSSIDSESAGLSALNSARATEGLAALNTPSDFLNRPPAERILILFNLERQDRGLSTFSQNNPVLAQVALNHSLILVDLNMFVKDDAVDGTSETRITTAPGIPNHYSNWTEKIGGAPYTTQIVWNWLYADQQASWQNRQAILGCFDTVGIGFATGGQYSGIATVDFLQATNNYQPPAAADITRPDLVVNQGQFNSLNSPNLSISATATDSESGVRHVVFFLDNQGYQNPRVTPSTRNGNTYSITFSNTSPGNHTVTAIAVDYNNNYTRSDMLVLDGRYQVPSAPANLVANPVSASRIDLSWTPGTANQSGFVLQSSFEGVNWNSVVTQTAPTYSDTGLIPATLYYYRVRATNSFGDSNYSNVVQATTMLAEPTNLNVVANSPGYNRLDLSWTSHSPPDSSFEIQRNDPGGNWVNLARVGAGVVAYQDNSVWPSTRYSYRVRALTASNSSLYSSAVTQTTGAVPVANTVSISDDYGETVDKLNPGTLSYALLNTTAGQAIAFSVMTVTVHGALPALPAAATGIYLNPAGNCATPVSIVATASQPVLTLLFNQGISIKAIQFSGFGPVKFGIGDNTGSNAVGNRLQCVGVRRNAG